MSAPATTAAISPALAAVEGVKLRHLCDISIDLDPQTIASPAGTKMLFALVQGRCEGERLSGTFRGNSGDWLTLGSDRIGRIDVRATLETDDGEFVYMTNTGRLGPVDAAIAGFEPGQRTRWNEMYARSAPMFETGSERYAWLNGIITVAVNEISLDHVDYRIFEVL